MNFTDYVGAIDFTDNQMVYQILRKYIPSHIGRQMSLDLWWWLTQATNWWLRRRLSAQLRKEPFTGVIEKNDKSAESPVWWPHSFTHCICIQTRHANLTMFLIGHSIFLFRSKRCMHMFAFLFRIVGLQLHIYTSYFVMAYQCPYSWR